MQTFSLEIEYYNFKTLLVTYKYLRAPEKLEQMCRVCTDVFVGNAVVK